MAHRLTVRARRDVLNIWRHIAADNQDAADRFVDLLTHYFRFLGEIPVPAADVTTCALATAVFRLENI